MKIPAVLLLAWWLPLSVMAAGSISISPKAEWVDADRVPDNIKAECDLPAFQAETVSKYLKEKSVSTTLADKEAIPTEGYFLQLRIVDAISSGNAFMGHRKSVALSAKLYLNGAEVAKTVKTRDSMGGVAAGFKGSCTVLRRCCETLGKDIAAWTTDEMAKKQ